MLVRETKTVRNVCVCVCVCVMCTGACHRCCVRTFPSTHSSTRKVTPLTHTLHAHTHNTTLFSLSHRLLSDRSSTGSFRDLGGEGGVPMQGSVDAQRVTPKSKRAAVTPTGTWSREDDGSGIHMRNPMIQVTRGGEDGGETKVQRSTSILQHVSADLRGDAEVVLEAVKRNGNEMEHASPDLRRDKAFIIKALRQRSGTSSELPPLGNGDVAQHSPSSPSVVGSSRSDPVLARLTPHQRVATLEASRTLERIVRSAEDSECAV